MKKNHGPALSIEYFALYFYFFNILLDLKKKSFEYMMIFTLNDSTYFR